MMKIFGSLTSRQIVNSGALKKSLFTMKTSRFMVSDFLTSYYAFFGTLKFNNELYQRILHRKIYTIIIDGYIFNPAFIDANVPLVRAKKSKVFLSADNILSGYKKYGKKFLARLNGSFVIVIYNHKTHAVDIITDKYGSKSIFYTLTKDGFTFASELKAFPEALFNDGNINWRTVASILAYKQAFGKETLLKNVFLAPKGTITSFTNNTITFTPYCKRYKVQPKMSDKAIINRAITLYKNAIVKTGYAASTLTKKLLLPLSGGYDTRLFCSVIKKYTNIQFATMTTDKDLSLPLDKILGKKVANVLGVNNTYTPVPPNLYKRYMIPKIYFLDGMTTVEHTWLMPLIYSFHHPIVTLDGFPGDILGVISEEVGISNSKNILQNKNPYRYLADHLLPRRAPKNMNRWYGVARITYDVDYCKDFFTNEIFRKIKSSYRDQVLGMLNRLPLKSRALYTIFNLEWTDVLYLGRLQNARFYLLYPYLENQLFDFMASIPYARRKKLCLISTVLHSLIPQSMEVESTNDDDIGLKYNHLTRRAIKYSEGNKKFLKNIARLIELPEFIKLNKREFVKRMSEQIDTMSRNQDIALLEFLVWYNIFIYKRPEIRKYIHTFLDKNSKQVATL